MRHYLLSRFTGSCYWCVMRLCRPTVRGPEKNNDRCVEDDCKIRRCDVVSARCPSIYAVHIAGDRHHLQPTMSLRDRSRRGAPVFRLLIILLYVSSCTTRIVNTNTNFVLFFSFFQPSPHRMIITISYDIIGQQHFRLISVLRPLPPISPDTGSPARTGNS